METTTITLIIGLAGIASTFTLGTFGLYFTAKSRVSKHREVLFQRQMGLAEELVHLQERIRGYATILAAKDSSFKDRARNDIGDTYREYCNNEVRAAVVFPVHLWVEVRELSRCVSALIAEYDSTSTISSDSLKSLAVRGTKIGLLVRTLVGADELTEQSLSLFSRKQEYDNVVTLNVEFFEKMHADVNKKK